MLPFGLKKLALKEISIDMTSFASEQAYLKNEISVNKRALRYLKSELERVKSEMPLDLPSMGPREKIIDVFMRGIDELKNENKRLKDKLSLIDECESDNY